MTQRKDSLTTYNFTAMPRTRLARSYRYDQPLLPGTVKHHSKALIHLTQLQASFTGICKAACWVRSGFKSSTSCALCVFMKVIFALSSLLPVSFRHCYGCTNQISWLYQSRTGSFHSRAATLSKFHTDEALPMTHTTSSQTFNNSVTLKESTIWQRIIQLCMASTPP